MDIKNIVLLVVFIFGLVYIQLTYGQTVDDIINRYTRERGGKDKLTAITSLYMEGSAKMLGNDVAVKVIRVQGKLFRNEFTIGNMSGYSIVTPTKGWSFIPLRSPQAQTITDDRLRSMQTELDIAGPLVDYPVKGHTVKREGKENIAGEEAYKISLTLNTGEIILYFIHAENYLLVQTRQIKEAVDGSGQSEVVINYSDYKSVGGILFPHTIGNSGFGPEAGFITYHTIELNKEIDENKYSPDFLDS